MNLKTKAIAAIVSGFFFGLASVSSAPAGQAGSMPAAPKVKILPTSLLASLLTSGGAVDGVHINPKNYDVYTSLVSLFIQNSIAPKSSDLYLLVGNTPLTAFLPTDAAFQQLAAQLTGKTSTSVQGIVTDLSSLGKQGLEQLWEYSIVPGSEIFAGAALKANGKRLATGLAGKSIKVSVVGSSISLGDYSKNPDAKVILSQVDVNKKNKAVGHGVDSVPLPFELPVKK